MRAVESERWDIESEDEKWMRWNDEMNWTDEKGREYRKTTAGPVSCQYSTFFNFIVIPHSLLIIVYTIPHPDKLKCMGICKSWTCM